MSENNDFKILADLAEPIRQYLLKNYHMHCAVVITADNVKVVETQKSIPLSNSGKEL